MERGRAELNNKTITEWFGVLQGLYETHRYNPGLVFNMDETMIHHIARSRKVRVVVHSEQRKAPSVKLTIPRRYTLVGLISADGAAAPP